MKHLLLLSSLTFATFTAQANIEQIDLAASQVSTTKLAQLVEQTSSYEQAYANYRLAITANITGQSQLTKTALKDARESLEAMNQQQATADSLALLASVYGMVIATDYSQAAILGPQSAVLLEQAQELEPENPRVWLVKAISAFNTPSMYGGGKEKAQTLATQAISYFEQPCSDICWGHAEAYAWRGLAKQEQGDIAGAQADWQQALQVEADYGWAKFLLSQQTANH
ncbi:hypothetical protein G3R49_16540 [Shewanella sp. WXL01]|uniref:hypothetical protein n=1 Tax=Shewanella sp. WXL01 TaxID=2709721 RepID=UPI0014385F64|nr:hypothetical protein [Shewanella sp. WXL01]NKF52174.1 hypothetical protein [Shewanella sp. WXL01]